MQLKELGEKALIEILDKRFSQTDPRVIKGIGDDCAVTIPSRGKVLLSSTDTLTEEIHFSLTYTPPKLLGRKLVNVSVSDIIAMGGTPQFILLSITMPSTIDENFITELYRGVDEACKESSMVLIGGNMSSIPGEGSIVLTSTVLGEASKDKVIYRSGASAGEAVYVTGTIGTSYLGLIGLPRHLDPKPRTKIARTIARKGLATAMMDTSDGLAIDLATLAEASKVSAKVETTLLPISSELQSYLKKEKEDLQLPLRGGEDYELLFTAKEEHKEEIAMLAEQSGIAITRIGLIEISDKDSNHVRFIQNNGTELKIKNKGFDHYR